MFDSSVLHGFFETLMVKWVCHSYNSQPRNKQETPWAGTHQSRHRSLMTSQPRRAAKLPPLETQNCPTRLTPLAKNGSRPLHRVLHKPDKGFRSIDELVQHKQLKSNYDQSIIQMRIAPNNLTGYSWDKVSPCCLHTVSILHWVGCELAEHTLQFWKQTATIKKSFLALARVKFAAIINDAVPVCDKGIWLMWGHNQRLYFPKLFQDCRQLLTIDSITQATVCHHQTLPRMHCK